jgi:hypothetical protein
MSKTKLIFQGADNTSTENVQLQAYCTVTNYILVEIEDTDSMHDYNTQTIYLDRQTAINLVKQLKREIGKMEVDNG